MLAIDIGSSSIRCSLEHEGEIESVQKICSLTLNVCSVVDVVESLVSQCLSSIKFENIKVSQVALTGFAMNLFGVDNENEPCTELFTYVNAGEKATDQIVALKQSLDEKKLEHICGSTGTRFYHQSYATLRLRHMDSSYIKRFHTIASFLMYRWSGRFDCPISLSEASWTGMVNVQTMDWDADIIQIIGDHVATKLPVIVSTLFSVGFLETYKSKWPALRYAKIVVGIPDGLAANVGSGCCTNTRIAVTVGTSAAVRVIVKRSEILEFVPAIVQAGLFCYCIDDTRVIVGGALTDGGSVFEWVNRNVRTDVETEAKATSMNPPGIHGLVVLPYLNGERSTGWRLDAKMAIIGITNATEPHHILRASLEAVGTCVGRLIGIILALIPHDSLPILVISGTALEKSSLLKQIIADVSGLSLYEGPFLNEVTSRGASRFAAGENILCPPGILAAVPNRAYHDIYQNDILRKQERIQDLLFSI